MTALATAIADFQLHHHIFVELSIRDNFDIPKLHFLLHFLYFIRRFSTLNNFNTEYTEQLHIDMVKDAYTASNSKDKFPQMTAWLDQRERILLHDKYLKCTCQMEENNVLPCPHSVPSLILCCQLCMSVRASRKSVLLTSVIADYRAINFALALQSCVIQLQWPMLTASQILPLLKTIPIPFHWLPVYHWIKFVSQDLHSLDAGHASIVDSIHIDPLSKDKYGKDVPAQFDTVLIKCHPAAGVTSVKGTPVIVAP
ncbi:hypothetical protein AN958_07312 [Leucoagaricus sp. SymC.cos]|nr:hypothetical protein AN958_07312 [Leucoagaricus sp. SymC.cos]